MEMSWELIDPSTNGGCLMVILIPWNRIRKKTPKKQTKMEVLNEDDLTWKGPRNNLGTPLKFKMDVEHDHIPKGVGFFQTVILAI